MKKVLKIVSEEIEIKVNNYKWKNWKYMGCGYWKNSKNWVLVIKVK